LTPITGTAAQSFGNIFVPSNGTITAQIMGDVLQATVTNGFERKELSIRIQNVDSIEITEAPIYALLSLGGSMALTGLGVIFADAFLGLLCLVSGIAIVIWAIQKKRRLLVVIYSLRSVVPIYMNKSSEEYQQFARQVIAIARHLNALPTQPRQKGQVQPPPNSTSNQNEFSLQQQ